MESAGSVGNGRKDVVVFEAFTALEERQLDEEINFGNVAAELFDQGGRGHRGAAGGEEVIGEEDGSPGACFFL